MPAVRIQIRGKRRGQRGSCSARCRLSKLGSLAELGAVHRMRQRRGSLEASNAIFKQVSGNRLAIMFAVLGLGSLAVLIVGCSGGNPIILLLVLALGGFLFLHYIIWGRLLSRNEEREESPSGDP